MKLPALIAALVATSLIAGCQTTSSGCDGWKPIRPKRVDIEAISDQLVEDILSHNSHGAKVCGWRAK